VVERVSGPSAGFAQSIWLLLRSLLWTILLPGFVAGYAPWRYIGVGRTRFDWTSPLHVVGAISIGVGVVLLGTCIFEFARSGRGTLSPLDPPRHLVVKGLYRYVRNPMYVSVTTIIAGEALITRTQPIITYLIVWFVVVNLFVMGYEEPTLRHQFGASYDAYTQRVGRWIPRFRP